MKEVYISYCVICLFVGANIGLHIGLNKSFETFNKIGDAIHDSKIRAIEHFAVIKTKEEMKIIKEFMEVQKELYFQELKRRGLKGE